ncbi:MAG: transporter permease, partial [Frankiales bacterium]|nr:transporter permease [Frankiales bacterium]
NQFTPLLIVYRERAGYTQLDVDVFLGAYVLGLVPGLLLASALSDRYGRRPLLAIGALASIAGSAVLALGDLAGSSALIAGRLLSGLAVGIAMAVGTAWVSELSAPPFDGRATPGAGPRRASIALTLGLGVGPGVAGVLAQWAALPLVLAYLVHIGLTLLALALLQHAAVETRFERGPARLRDRLRVPAAGHRRFRWVVLPMAPWIFGSAAVAYAIIPQLTAHSVGRWALIFAAALTVATLGAGVAVQPWAKRLDSTSSARAAHVSMSLMSLGIAAAAVTALTHSPWFAVPVALLLGAAYGIAIVSGLLEVQRIAEPDELAGLTGVYYALAYLGFLLPATLAGLGHWFGYPEMLAALSLLALGCTLIIGRSSTRHLPG